MLQTRCSLLAFTLFALPASFAFTTLGADRPLKVFILAGQSNMQGHASVATFDSLADDPKTAPLLKEMRGPDGKPRVCEKVWISSIGCLGDAYSDLGEQTGNLTAGFGAFGMEGERIGPEFLFGLTMQRRLNEPILIIKTSWGGRSLMTDFRPPSAGKRVFNDFTLKQWKERGVDAEEEAARHNDKMNGVFYRHMIEHVKKVLSDIKRVAPDYDEKQGCELAGFVWFQGFNDYVDEWSYPNRMQPGGYDEYADLLGHLIRDVRKDLSAPEMPFVIGIMGIDGEKGEKGAMKHFRDAQRKPAMLDEFKTNVFNVETAPFWDDDLDVLNQRMEMLNSELEQEFTKTPKITELEKELARNTAAEKEFSPEELKRLRAGVSNGGYHYLGAAKILAPIGQAFANALLESNHASSLPAKVSVTPPQPGEMAGYLLVPHGKVDRSYNAGFSMYVAAWPLLKRYPGQDFQSGLFGTWMFGQHDGPTPQGQYSDIEGGLGWWRDTRFATETPKFIMGGVALEFSEWANGPGAGKGRDWNEPAGHYAIAQLSPWVLWPPDGLNLKQGTNGELFGYGYLPLPLVAAKAMTAGKDLPTGDQSWTLFLNTGNFKGPVAFFVPYFWSKPTVEKPEFAGMFLDTRPSEPNKAVQMETQHVPAYIAKDAQGKTYARIAPTQFPAKADGEAPLIHRITAYNRAALWDGVKAWFDGGKEASGVIDVKASAVHTFNDDGGATWEIYAEGATDNKPPLAWNTFATPKALDEYTYGYQWDEKSVVKEGENFTLPQYYRLTQQAKGNEQWIVVSEKDVPVDTGLAEVEFPRAKSASIEPYITPNEAGSAWKRPGPAAGPFETKLGDGSVVIYSWYRFADQPALLNADLTVEERQTLQNRIEMLHRTWTKEREYLPPPTVGALAELDPALVVTPPKGLEIGYVPIVTEQSKSK